MNDLAILTVRVKSEDSFYPINLSGSQSPPFPGPVWVGPASILLFGVEDRPGCLCDECDAGGSQGIFYWSR
jgi:hypothetical protein